jgi:hypothetical protein
MRKHLIEYRNRFVNEDIRLHWGMSKKGFDTFITDMKLPRAPRTKVDTSGKRKVRGGTGSKKKFRRNTEEIVESALTIVKPPAEVVYQEPVVLPKIDGLSLTYTGIYDPKQIINKLEKLGLILSDEGNKFEQSPDPLLHTLKDHFQEVKLGKVSDAHTVLSPILSDSKLFGVDLYKVGLGEKVEGMFVELAKGSGAVRNTLKKYIV